MEAQSDRSEAAFEEVAKDEIFSSTQRFDVDDVFDDGSSEFDWLLQHEM